MNPAEAYILKQEEPFQSILLQLQAMIKALAPDAELLYKWNIPFYYCKGIPICYLNQSKDYVDLGFWHGERLTEFRDYFVTKNRTAVTSLRFKCVDDIKDEVIEYVIKQQIAINTNPYKLILMSKTKK